MGNLGEGTRPPRDYAREPFTWYRTPLMAACAAQEPACRWIWPVLRCMGKEQSDVDTNPHGWADVVLADVAVQASVPGGADQVRRALDVLLEAELIEVEDGRLGLTRVRLIEFDAVQCPRGSSAEDQQRKRDREQAKRAATSGDRQGDVGSSSGGSQQTRPDESREDPVDLTNVRSLPESPTLAPVDNSGGREWPARCRKLDGRTVTAQEQDDAWFVFDAWLRITGRHDRPGPAHRLTTDRARRIVQRRRDGFALDELVAAIEHWAADAYHVEGGYDDLTTFLKDDTKVAKALEALARPARRNDAAGTTVPLAAVEAIAAAKRSTHSHEYGDDV
jgi:hypothetical protein